MNLLSRKESLLYLLGDIASLYVSLWLVLSLRYWSLPTDETWATHLVPFTLLFAIWLVVFFISGLYEKKISFSKKDILVSILKVQGVNSVIAVLFFYFSPVTQITPKTNLFIYLGVSVLLLGAWRYASASIAGQKRTRVCIVARGSEAQQLCKDLAEDSSGFDVKYFLDLDCGEVDVEQLVQKIYVEAIDFVILDTKDDAILPILPVFYDLMFSGVQFVEMADVYEAVYNRVPLQLVKHGWFLENVKSKPHALYDFFKRAMDIVASFLLILVSLVFYPFVYVALKLDDRKGLFSIQERVGKNNKPIKMLKFRTMTYANDGGAWKAQGKKNEVTRVGAFLRKTRIDELPQLWNVLRGDLSLIGPRPEFHTAVESYMSEIPYYNVRHLIKPGLSGWAQIYHDNHPHHGLDIEATSEKLSYDLYYIKNRSIILDAIIALKTLKTLFLSKGK
jgi:exopolysaccharide biosynthesis polyprenyl glycosylphosphotransferase